MTEAAPVPRGWPLSSVVGGAVVVWGVLVGTLPFNDNSFFTHLATGRLILDDGGVPRHDVYSATARGASWVVQSWLASVLFAGAEELGGPLGIRLLILGLTVTIAVLAWRLTSAATSLLPRVALIVPVLVVGGQFWAERPLLFGLLGLELTLFALERRLDPRWLVPAYWVWVNTHGSFPLGLAAIITVALGTTLDRQPTDHERRVLLFAGLGTLLGAVNPLGPRLLVFPLELLARSGLLHDVSEWQAPGFTTLDQRLFLVQVILAVFALARRPSYRFAVPFAVFLVAALLGIRNVPVFSLVLLPGMAAGLGDLGSLKGDERRGIARPATVVVGALALLIAVVGLSQRDYALQSYPVAALGYVDAERGLPLDPPVMGREVVGSVLELVYGRRANVYTDDRFDMFPVEKVRESFDLLKSPKHWEQILDDNHAQVVVWETDGQLSGLLRASPHWQVVYSDEIWLVAERR